MHPEAATLWRGPRWTLALLLAALGTLGPFSIDTYLPAFAAIARSLDATPVQMQQTLSAYLFGFALMNLFHGALSDAFGRRPVVIAAMAVFTLASVGCALAPSVGALVGFRALQGMSAGGGMVVSRAIIRDLFAPADAQRVMSQVTIYFGVAPAVAPMIGGWMIGRMHWHAIFWLLAAIGVVLTVTMAWKLPESLHVSQRQPFRAMPLLRGYASLLSSSRFLALVAASGVPFNGMFLYVLSAPAWLGDHLRLAPGQFFVFFVLNIGGIMAGAWWSGRLAGRITPAQQTRRGFTIMVASTAVNVVANLVAEPHAAWAMLPVAVYAVGWALVVPVVTLMLLDLAPSRRGMVSSVQACVGAATNGLVAGVVAPLVMHSTVALAWASAALMAVGLLAWRWVGPRLPKASAA